MKKLCYNTEQMQFIFHHRMVYDIKHNIRKWKVDDMYSLDDVRVVDPEIAQAIVDEQDRQNSHIELIASENWVSKAVMAAMGSPLTNKYAEGYPGKRYYGGCDCVDVVEDLARDRAKELFGC